MRSTLHQKISSTAATSVAAQNAAQPPATPDTAPQARARVYITDDHPIVRRGLAAMIEAEPDLELCGEAADCATATNQIARLLPDVVIVDISLQGNNGLELIKNIKALDPRIRMLVLSVHDESIYALRVIKAGARGYVMKQDIATKVIEGIRRILSGKMYVSERISGQIFNRFVGGREDNGDSPISSLTDRELEVTTLIGNGLATREIAARLRMSVKTVETHRAHLKSKLNLPTSTRLAQFCVAWVEECKRLPAPEQSESTDGDPLCSGTSG